MSAPQTSGDHPRRRRRILAGCGALLITLMVIYAACNYQQAWSASAGPGQLLAGLSRPSPGAAYHGEDEEDVSHGDVPAADEDPFVLHPQEHIYREPTTIHLSWNISLGDLAPDGVTRRVYLINGNFPGPTIEARPGDELVVDVHNAVDDPEADGLAIHWHGLNMQGSNDMDGVVGITQCAIPLGGSFTYRFRIAGSQSGTFWYHAHSAVQRADGLYGGLVVHRPVDGGRGLADYGDAARDGDGEHEVEQLLLVGDWYHRDGRSALAWYDNPSHFGNEPVPDSLLINGKGYFDCSMATKARPLNCSEIEKPAVTFASNRRFRLRVVNIGSSAGFTMSLTQGSMKVVAVDGGNPTAADTPKAASIGVLYPGERLDLVVERTNRTQEESGAVSDEVTIKLNQENMPLMNFALTPKQTFPLIWGASLNNRAINKPRAGGHPQPQDHFFLADLSAPPLATPLTQHPPAETLLLYINMELRASHSNKPVGVMNHTSWIGPSDPFGPPLLSLDRDSWGTVGVQPTPAQKFHVPWFREVGGDRWVEVVLNNVDDKGHPFHLHGHTFYVVQTHQSGPSSYDTYNPYEPAPPPGGALNEGSPLRKDTVYVPSMGYAILRFPLVHEGLWLLHCHVLWHQAVGMAMAVQIGEISDEAGRRSGEVCGKHGAPSRGLLD